MPALVWRPAIKCTCLPGSFQVLRKGGAPGACPVSSDLCLVCVVHRGPVQAPCRDASSIISACRRSCICIKARCRARMSSGPFGCTGGVLAAPDGIRRRRKAAQRTRQTMGHDDPDQREDQRRDRSRKKRLLRDGIAQPTLVKRAVEPTVVQHLRHQSLPTPCGDGRSNGCPHGRLPAKS